jgi:23S rRNA (cytidine2498-2'-O)-methyltransferase
MEWAGNPFRQGDTAVEIGSAPGGASFALLEQGLNVVGIDPGEMAQVVFNHPKFKHFKKPVAMIPREELPESIEWILLDMNVEPRISLFAVDRLVTRTQSTLLGVFLTVKLNKWKIASEIPSMLEHVRAMGFVRVKAAQLSHHKQEIAIFGLTRLGVRRKSITK